MDRITGQLPRRQLELTVLVSLLMYLILCRQVAVESFAPIIRVTRTLRHHPAVDRSICGCSTTLFATTKKKKKRPNSSNINNSSGGFGGAALETCPCGSSAGERYGNCCGKLHRDVNAHRSAAPEQVVRARYSAYAKKQADFLMASTHPLHKDFNTDWKQWKKTIKTNMYDNFDMPRCRIVSETIGVDGDEDMATVQFIAEMVLRETGETTSFMETSLFERAKTDGAWLYKSGTIEAAPGSEAANDAGVGTIGDSVSGDDGSVEEKLATLL